MANAAIVGDQLVVVEDDQIVRSIADQYGPALDLYGKPTGFTWDQEVNAGRVVLTPSWKQILIGRIVYADLEKAEPKGAPVYRR